MEQKINDIKLALHCNAFQSALALALTLPDICSQIEYPNEKVVSKRYSDWCNKYLNYSDAHIGFGTESAELNGKLVYALRCAFLHSGNDKILSQPVANGATITKFILCKPGGLNDYGFRYKITNVSVETEIDVEYLIDLICEAVQKYYNSKTDKTVFDDHICMIK